MLSLLWRGQWVYLRCRVGISWGHRAVGISAAEYGGGRQEHLHQGLNVVARKAAKEKKNEALYKVPCAQAGLDFKSFVTTVWGGFGVSATELIKVMAQRLVERENVSNSWAMTSIRRHIQSGFMKQIAINGLTYVRKIRAQMGAGQL